MTVRALRAVVSGRVQGVGFRDACVAEARRLGLDGWVANRADGGVEAWLQGGDDAALAAMQRWLGHGPPGARVARVQTAEAVPDPALAGFARRAGDRYSGP